MLYVPLQNNVYRHQQILFVLTTAVTLMSILRVKLLPTCDNLIFSTPTNIAIFMAIV